MNSYFPDNESQPGLSEIKQVELYSKWRPLLPEQYQDEMCPKPSDNVLENVKKDRAKKRKEKSSAEKKKKN